MTDDAAIDEIWNAAWEAETMPSTHTWHGGRSQRQVEGSVTRF
jgi:hypothetical protein